MNSAKTFRNILLACGLGGAIASGCVITTGSVDCEVCNDSPLCHNQEVTNTNGEVVCVCDPGYTWEDPNDSTNLECERVPSKPGASNCVEPNSEQIGEQCYCVDGYNWCTADENDLTCCIDPAQETAAGGTDTDDSQGTASDTDGSDTDPSGTDTDDSSSTTGQNQPPPDSECTEDGLRACSNTSADDVSGSTAWTCLSGAWQELDLDAECEFEGGDFGYGCYDGGADVGVVIECGNGPGTDCTDERSCSDSDLLQLCIWGKLTDVSCNTACTDVNAETTWDFGECLADATGDFCQCCDDPDGNTCDCGGASTCEGA